MITTKEFELLGLISVTLSAEDERQAREKLNRKLLEVGVSGTVIEVKEFTPKCLKECTLYRNEEGS